MTADRSFRIVVAGAGSIGCYVGGCLALARRDVTLLLRPALGEAIARHGLRVSDLDGMDRPVPPSAVRLATDPEAALADADIVLVTVKSGDTAAMAELVAEHGPSGATVLSLQNGVGNVDVLLDRLGGMARVVAGMVPFNVVQTHPRGEPPRFHRATSGTVLIGAGVAGLRDALKSRGLAVAEHPDMAGVLWGKLLLNLNNALNALADLPLRRQLAQRPWQTLFADQVAEGLAAIRAEGIKPVSPTPIPLGWLPSLLRLPDPIFEALLGRTMKIDPEARSSMWEDLQRGRRTEIDYLQGVITEIADRRGLQVPLSRRIVELIRKAEADGKGSPALTPEQVRG
jgi:2-dehydropantoate 2-reductase